MYDAVIIGNEACVHAIECDYRVRDCVMAMRDGIPAKLVALDGDDRVTTGIELSAVFGIHAAFITYHECIDHARRLGASALHRTDFGALMINVEGKRYVLCDKCGWVNDTMRVTCVKCHRDLYETIERKFFELNRRLKDAIGGRDAVRVSEVRRAIRDALMNVKDCRMYGQDEQGRIIKRESLDMCERLRDRKRGVTNGGEE